jgi:cobalt-zinc-cadmium efflux system outer membrane protein
LAFRILWKTCLVSGLLGAAASATGQVVPEVPAAIKRDAAVAEALARNPQLAASRAQVEEARAGIAQATAFPDPAFAWDYEQQTGLFNFSSAVTRDVGAGFTVPFPEKFRLNRKASTATLRAAEASLKQLQQQIASQTAQAFDALQVAEAQLENDRESERLSQDILNKTQARYDAGTVARLDVLQAKVSLAQAKNQTITDERTVMTARTSLNRLMGRDAGSQAEPAEKLALPAEVPPLPDLVRLAMENRPELAVIQAQRESSRFAAKLAHLYWLPDLNFTLYRNFTQGAPAAYSNTGSIAIPLFFWQHEKGDVAFAEQRQIELAANQADINAQVNVDVRNAFANYDTSRRQALWIRDELLPQVQEAYEVASTSYGLGGSSALNLINAKVALLGAETQFVQALGAANDASADLERAVGAPLPATPSEGGSHE